MSDEAAARQKHASSLVGDALEPRKVLVIDIGGTSVKLLVSGQHERRMFPSGPKMMPGKMVRKIRGCPSSEILRQEAA